ASSRRSHRSASRSSRAASCASSAAPSQPWRCLVSCGMTLDLTASPHDVAPALIGAELTFDGVGGVIVEVEAYDHEDPAAHGFGTRLTDRNASMFLEGGHVYVYRSYGIHWCMNVVCGEAGTAGAVLIRALEPTRGVERMIARRGLTDPRL